MNAYEGKACHCEFAGKTVWSMPERFEIYIAYKRRYINTLSFLSLRYILTEGWDATGSSETWVEARRLHGHWPVSSAHTHAPLISRHGIAMPKGLYFTNVVFSYFLLSSIFRRLISEVTERISTKLGHIFTHRRMSRGLGGLQPPGSGKMIFFGQSGNFSAIFLQRCPGFFGQNWFSPPKKIGPYAYVFTYAWYLKNLVWILQAFTPTGWRQKPLWDRLWTLTEHISQTEHGINNRKQICQSTGTPYIPQIWWTLVQKGLRTVGEFLPTP